MQTSKKVVECIRYANSFRPPIYEKQTIIQKIFRSKQIKNEPNYEELERLFEVESNITFSVLWRIQGLYDGYMFSEKQKIDCLNFWVKKLYNKEINIIVFIEKFRSEIRTNQRRIKEEAERTNSIGLRVNYINPIDRISYYVDENLGSY